MIVYVQITLKLKDNEMNCIISSDLILDINHDIKIKSIPDFNPHWYKVSSQKCYVYFHKGENSGFPETYCAFGLPPCKYLGNICYYHCTTNYLNQFI